MNILSDNAIMLKIKAGDLDKMALLFERYHKALYGFIFRMTKQKEASEDMVQNVFLRMLKYRGSFTGTGEFRTWMYHLARNVLHDNHKKNATTTGYFDVAEMENLTAADLANDRIEKQQDLKILEDALDKLSLANRELLVLCRFQELKYSEIAQLLNITEGAVKVRVHRALNELRNNYLQTV